MKLIILLFGLSIITQSKSINFTEKEITSGITFVKEAQVSLSFQKWKMVYYYNLGSYLEQIAFFENIINEMRKACDLLKIDGSTCLTLIVKFEQYREKINHSNKIIEKYNLKGQHRPKKSLLPSIGVVLGALFGLVDEEQAQVLSDRIEQLERFAQTKGEFSTERLSIIQSSLMINDKRFNELTSKIVMLSAEVKNLNSTTFKQKEQALIADNFNYLVHTATLIMIEHNHMSDIIMQLLTNTISTKITELIPVNMFQDHLRDISFNLAIEKKLPIDVERDNVYELFNIISIKSTVVDKKLMMIISIPIINEISYDLYRTVPIPTEHDKEAIIIQPSTEHILVNKAASQYIPITPNELTNCQKQANNHLICTPASPIYLNKHYKCEFCLFNEIDIPDLELHCEANIHKIPKKNYFVKLHAPNYYYVFINNPIIIRFICAGREPEQMLITKHGVLLIDDHCVMKTDGLLIEAKYTSETNSSIMIESPRFNVSNLTNLQYIIAYDANRTKSEENERDVTLLENFDIETNELMRRIEQSKIRENGINFQQPDILTTPSWSKIIASFFILIIICIVIIMATKLVRTFMLCTE